jgi:hypothetical protein
MTLKNGTKDARDLDTWHVSDSEPTNKFKLLFLF